MLVLLLFECWDTVAIGRDCNDISDVDFNCTCLFYTSSWCAVTPLSDCGVKTVKIASQYVDNCCTWIRRNLWKRQFRKVTREGRKVRGTVLDKDHQGGPFEIQLRLIQGYHWCFVETLSVVGNLPEKITERRKIISRLQDAVCVMNLMPMFRLIQFLNVYAFVKMKSEDKQPYAKPRTREADRKEYGTKFSEL